MNQLTVEKLLIDIPFSISLCNSPNDLSTTFRSHFRAHIRGPFGKPIVNFLCNLWGGVKEELQPVIPFRLQHDSSCYRQLSVEIDTLEARVVVTPALTVQGVPQGENIDLLPQIC